MKTFTIRRPIALVATGVLAASAFAFAPVAAPDGTDASVGTVARSLAVGTVEGERVATVDGLHDRFGTMPGEDLRDGTAWIRALRRVVEADGTDTFAAGDACLGAGLRVQAACVAAADHEEDGDGGDEEFSFTYTAPLGDLDGDGYGDLATVRVDFTPDTVTESTTARSGLDGAVLWSTTAEGFGFGFTVDDVDGDGGQDLVQVTFGFGDVSGSDSCTPLRCTFDASFGESIGLVVRSGATGAQLSSSEHDLRVSFRGEDTSVGVGPAPGVGQAGVTQGTVTFEVVDELAGLRLVDHDGDGRASLLTLGIEVTEEETFVYAGRYDEDTWSFDDLFASEYTGSLAGTTELVDPLTGARTVVADTEDDGVLALPTVVEVDGRQAIALDRFDGVEEISRGGCAFSDTLMVYECGSLDEVTGDGEEAGWTRQLLDADLEPLWTVGIPTFSSFPFAAGGDLDGDGSDDLLDIRADEETWEIGTAVLSGVDGSLVGVLDVFGGVADGGDLLGLRYDEEYDYDEETDEEFGSFTASAVRLDVATGEVLASAPLDSVTFRYGNGPVVEDGFLFVDLVELTSGSVDVLAAAEQYLLEEVYREEICDVDEETGEEFCFEIVVYDVTDVSSRLTVLEGDLTPVLRADLGAGYLVGVGDVHDDGEAELFVVDIAEVSDEFGTFFEYQGISALRLDGTALWTVDGEVEDVVGLVEAPGGVDVVVTTFDTGEVVVRDGATLTERLRLAV